MGPVSGANSITGFPGLRERAEKALEGARRNGLAKVTMIRAGRPLEASEGLWKAKSGVEVKNARKIGKTCQ